MATTYKKLDHPVTVYKTNPSIEPLSQNLSTKKKKMLFKDGNKALVDAETGELAGRLQRVYIEEIEVDTEKFMKVYANTIDDLMNLSSAGLKVFKLIYLEIMNTPNADIVFLDFNAIKYLNKWCWSQTTFISGINDLLSKNIIYKALGASQYFINIRVFFNGDRISIIKSYRLKKDHNDFFNNLHDNVNIESLDKSEKLNILIAKMIEKGFSKEEATNQALELL